jgi:hypothetical protein
MSACVSFVLDNSTACSVVCSSHEQCITVSEYEMCCGIPTLGAPQMDRFLIVRQQRQSNGPFIVGTSASCAEH